ncbi:MAG: transglycosylase domain-containing protein [Sandaracinaceae bacterium]
MRRAARPARVAAVLALCAVVAPVAWVALATDLDRAAFVRPRDAVQVVDRAGVPLRHQRVEHRDRRWLPLGAISPRLQAAVIAVEDRRFREHGGVDGWASARALVSWALPGRPVSGGSTITQQLIKAVYGRPHGLWDKPVEIVRAVRLESREGKDWILEQYLNRLPYGNGIVGAGRAAEVYLGRPATDLSWSQAALLAGIPQAPSVTEPRRHRRRAEARRRFVLHRLRALGAIDEGTFERALADVPRLAPAAFRPWRAPRFVDGALARWRRGELPARAGVLRTSLDWRLQRETERLLRAAVRRHRRRGVTNGAAIAVANRTGEVLAYVGAARRGSEAPAGWLDLVQARRQPGSTLKPFAYEQWFERGGTAASVLGDLPRPMVDGDGRVFEAENYDRQVRGPVRARVALGSSLNLAALDVARRVGPERLVARLRDLGFRLEEPEELGGALVLGGADVSVAELAAAYVALARGGTAVPLRFGPACVDAACRGGARGRPPRLLEAGPTAVTVDILRDGAVRRQAFGDDLEELFGGPFGLKTGTSSGARDVWTAAFTPDATVVVWLGDPAGAPLAGLSGFEAAATPAVAILRAVQDRVAALELDREPSRAIAAFEDGVVCGHTGLLAGPACTHRVMERFVPGTAPTRICDRHRPDGTLVLSERYRRWVDLAHPAGVTVDDAPSGALVPRVRHPAPGARWLLDPRRSAPAVPLRATVGNGPAPPQLRWEIDGRPLPGARWTPPVGEHRLVAILGRRRSAPVDVVVGIAPGGSPLSAASGGASPRGPPRR